MLARMVWGTFIEKEPFKMVEYDPKKCPRVNV